MARPRQPLLARFARHTERRGACLVWTGVTNDHGYGRIKVNGRIRRAHRVRLEIALGRQLAVDELALHRCDNPPCVEPTHLYAGSVSDNLQDRERTGRGHSPRRLTPVEVATIRLALAAGRPHHEIAATLAIGRTTVTMIATGRHYGTAA